MLAQNFLSASDLDCTEDELSAAIRVLGMLERQELVHVDANSSCSIPNGFCMAFWCSEDNECGTAGCIAGWIEKVQDGSISQDCLDSWSDLFVPRNWDSKSREYTIERCAKALRAKLMTGRADWSLD